MTDDDRAAYARVRQRVAGWRPSPTIYWLDLGGSAAVAWTMAWLATTLLVDAPVVSVAAIVVGALAVWRAAYFIHEIAHLKAGEVPGFEVGWHLVLGLWAALPSAMIDAHVDHHRPRTYGTDCDPEYERVATWGRGRLVTSVVAVLPVPPLLVLRWAIAPLSWVVPPLRRLLIRRASTLASNAAYVRDIPTGAKARRFAAQEAAEALALWLAAGAVWLGWLPLRAVVVWWTMLALALALNQVRTLVSHRYESSGDRLAKQAQVEDTLTFGGGLLTEVLAPLGNRHHALHHLLPRLPYHHLPAAHRALVETLPADAPYHRTHSDGIGRALLSLWRRAARPRRAVA